MTLVNDVVVDVYVEVNDVVVDVNVTPTEIILKLAVHQKLRSECLINHTRKPPVL